MRVIRAVANALFFLRAPAIVGRCARAVQVRPMIHSLTSLSPVAIIVVSLLGLGFGFAWYSPYLFGGPFLLTVVPTFAPAAREATNAPFENRTFRHLLVVSGHDVVLCVFQGAVPGAWH